MAFSYTADIGQDSVPGILAAENASGIPHTISSTFRPNSITLSGHLSYHARHNAVDSYSSAENMRKLAAWIMEHYGPYTLELIHSTGNGFFVHNGKVVGADYYGAAIVGQHYNHVHWAITNRGLKAGSSKLGTGGEAGHYVSAAYNPNTNNGCAMGALVAIAGIGTVAAGAATALGVWLS